MRWLTVVLLASLVMFGSPQSAPQAIAAPNPPANCKWAWVRVGASGRDIVGKWRAGNGAALVRVLKCDKSTRQDKAAQQLPTLARRPSQPSRLQQCIAAARKKAAATRTPSLEQLCFTPLVGAEAPPAAPTVDFVQLARSLSVRLRLPDTNPRFGPDPQANEWKMLAVGYPVWLWVDGPTTRTATASASGFTFHLVATRTGTTFDLGDGHTLRCATTTPYSSSVKPGTPSPTCGHIYAKPSTPGRYTVTATAEWQVRWSVDGLSGSFPMRYSDTSTLTIGELQALVR